MCSLGMCSARSPRTTFCANIMRQLESNTQHAFWGWNFILWKCFASLMCCVSECKTLYICIAPGWGCLHPQQLAIIVRREAKNWDGEQNICSLPHLILCDDTSQSGILWKHCQNSTQGENMTLIIELKINEQIFANILKNWNFFRHCVNGQR